MRQDWEHTVDPLASRGQTVNYLSLLAQIKSLPSDAIATPLDKAVAYSGPAASGRTSNRRKALENSRIHDLVPIDFTPAGQWLDQQHLYDSSSVTANQATWLWSALSERYMGEAKGTITAFVEGHAPDRVFSRVELRSFVENLSLVGIQYLDLDRKRKLVWVAREFLEKAARAEGLSFEQAALHSASPDTRIPENQLRLYDLSFPVHRLLSSIIGRAPQLKTSPLGEAHEVLVSQLDQIRALYIKDEVRSATVQLAVARVLDLQRFPSALRRAIDLEIERFLEGRTTTENLIQTVAEQATVAKITSQIRIDRRTANQSLPLKLPNQIDRESPDPGLEP